MNFKDQWATDEDGKEFIFTVEMQRALSNAGLPVEAASLVGFEMPAAAPQRDSRGGGRDRDDRGRRDRDDRGGRGGRDRDDRGRRDRDDVEEPPSMTFDPATGKYIGRLKFFKSQQGFGFILRGGGESVFFHKSKVNDDIDTYEKGQWLLYEIRDGAKGEEAYDIEKYTGELPF